MPAPRTSLLRAAAIAIACGASLAGVTAATAQTQSVQQAIASAVEQNGEDAAALAAALLPIITANPQAIRQIVAAASSSPPALGSALAMALGYCQAYLVQSNPAIAQAIAVAMTSAPVALQASYSTGVSSGSAPFSLAGGGAPGSGVGLTGFGTAQGAPAVSGTKPEELTGIDGPDAGRERTRRSGRGCSPIEWTINRESVRAWPRPVV